MGGSHPTRGKSSKASRARPRDDAHAYSDGDAAMLFLQPPPEDDDDMNDFDGDGEGGRNLLDVRHFFKEGASSPKMASASPSLKNLRGVARETSPIRATDGAQQDFDAARNSWPQISPRS